MTKYTRTKKMSSLLEQKIAESVDLEFLNKKYRTMTPEERIREVYYEFDRILLSSSFGTTAVFQLHLFYKQQIIQPVHFIDTTFHFEETLAYRNQLQQLFDLEIIDIKPDTEWNKITHEAELWKIDPDHCCSINKVKPFEKIKEGYDLWISGLMRWQSSHREQLNIFEKRKGIIKFYPILDVSEKQARNYIKKYELPVHPLKPLGYESIGCIHCTLKGKKRKGRWAKTIKTECGLHL
ncbi:MAG: phosphoadenylyl-sulfate reductase [Cyclobacteriaceae bacterium]|nr:phosphoadenylyl-sulfate reductase [Cyclobacteriaceae bacterium]